jgi:hypothetical protein
MMDDGQIEANVAAGLRQARDCGFRREIDIARFVEAICVYLGGIPKAGLRRPIPKRNSRFEARNAMVDPGERASNQVGPRHGQYHYQRDGRNRELANRAYQKGTDSLLHHFAEIRTESDTSKG